MAPRPPAARPSFPGRIRRDWGALTSEQKLPVVCALLLFLTMFLPWYQKDVDALVDGKLVSRSDSMSAFGAFSFVEAAVLLVAAAVVALFYARAEGKRFHLPFGDGLVTMAGGVWVCLLVFIRQLDKPDADGGAQVSATVGVHWGIFVTFIVGLALAWAGWRLHQAHVAEPGDTSPGARQRRRRGPGPRPPGTPRPTTAAPRAPQAPRREDPPTDETRQSPRVTRGPLPDPHAEPTSIAPQRGPKIDGGTQLSFDEQQ